MTNSFRTIATAAATVAVTVALVGGIIAPVNAAPAGLPPIGPINPGPSVPSIPPGGAPQSTVQYTRPPVVLTACSFVFSSPAVSTVNDFAWGVRGLNRFIDYGQSGSSDRTNILDANLAAVAVASPHRSCTWGGGSKYEFITTSAINPAQYTTLISYYRSHATWTAVGGSPGTAGTSSITYFAIGGFGLGTRQHFAAISSDGWWIALEDQMSAGIGQYLLSDSVWVLLAANPTRI